MTWAGRLVRNILLWTIPAWAAWTLLTPFYNRFLVTAGENLLQISESPNVTDLHLRGQDAYVQRRDFPTAKSLVHTFRVTDLHFHLVLLGALFLAVPGVPWREKLENLGWAVLVTVFFDLFLCFFMVKGAYATRLGVWSLEHYGPFARNFYGLGRHLLDLPFKLGLPLLLWAGFYLGRMMEEIRLSPHTESEPRKPRAA